MEDWRLFLSGIYAQLESATNDAQLTAQAQFARGQAQYLSGDYARALATYNSIDVAKTTREYALMLYGKGTAYNASKEYAKAEASCREVVNVSTDPQLLWLGHKCLGDIYSSQKKKERAEEAYAQARRFGYERPEGGLDSLRKLVKDGSAREALPGLQALVAKEPSGAAFTLLGEAYEKEGRKASAYKAYSDAIAAYLEKRRGARPDPAAAEALFKVGKIDLDENNTEKGWIHVACALDLDTEAKFIDRKKASQMDKEAYNKLSKRTGGFTRPAEPCELLAARP
jgi:tetratricopeptide (TPR) repeat protein